MYPTYKTHYYQVHKTVAAAVLEEIAKPLKVFGEIQHKARKATEALVRELFDNFFKKIDAILIFRLRKDTSSCKIGEARRQKQKPRAMRPQETMKSVR